MEAYNISKHSSFYAIGISYKKADAALRGKFSLDETAKNALLDQAKSAGIDGILVTSTCNRTEIFGFAQHPFQLIQLLCGNSNGTVEEFQSIGYVYKNNHAISHLFRVGTGLDSQILGDFEIISQIKQSFIASKEKGVTNHFMERLCNSVIQASKRIKNETEISSGATSVAFASVQYILAKVPDISNKNILLFGTGKIGRNTCENLVKHTKNDHIVLINRTKDKAEKVAGKFNLIVKEYSNLPEEIKKSDVLIVATGAQKPTISKELIYTSKDLLILDLSIPQNVDLNVEEHKNVTLVHLDQLSRITDDTLKRREKFIPQAEAIIQEVETDFKHWLETRKFAPTIKALKKKLKTLKDAEIDFQRKKISDFNDEQAEIISNRIIQKITTHFANHLKESSNTSDDSIELIKKVFQLETSK
ncbi:glutamyl-tRNA reductase [Galbibacter pacificus]|uniref:Glutamyl-tRNA reductase n=1 Tax=Galbibacter pacificus TaxID=2996052 RepID=A0ABT6FTY3_9FLAO|nr:glutamyl-tRNA reductase [Galbibacter pacificus]MDG3583246.1 glutamyl-tRNA reductase [Galbibacter pacificus]MDG3586727.1 glutamyl-tRNA reductase [Galbibacter pacificus]